MAAIIIIKVKIYNLAKFSIIVKFVNFENKLHSLYYDSDCLNNFKRLVVVVLVVVVISFRFPSCFSSMLPRVSFSALSVKVGKPRGVPPLCFLRVLLHVHCRGTCAPSC